VKIAEFAGHLDWRSVRYHLSSLFQLLGLILGVPTLGALLLREHQFAGLFLGLAVATWLVGTIRSPPSRRRSVGDATGWR
jgi:hypothetical protein